MVLMSLVTASDPELRFSLQSRFLSPSCLPRSQTPGDEQNPIGRPGVGRGKIQWLGNVQVAPPYTVVVAKFLDEAVATRSSSRDGKAVCSLVKLLATLYITIASKVR